MEVVEGLLKKPFEGVDSSRSRVPFCFYLLLFPPWNLGLMPGAPVAIVHHEIIFKIGAVHKGLGNGQKDSFWVSDDCGATILA